MRLKILGNVNVFIRKVLVFWVSSRSSEAELIENDFHHKMVDRGSRFRRVTNQEGGRVIPIKLDIPQICRVNNLLRQSLARSPIEQRRTRLPNLGILSSCQQLNSLGDETASQG